MLAQFEFDGVSYSIPDGPADIIKLPDGRLFRIGMWIETHPSQPGYLTEITQDQVADLRIVDATPVMP